METTRNETVNPDSIEIGTPSKGGAIKVYFDAADKVSAQKKIENILELREFMEAKIKVVLPKQIGREDV